MIDLLPLEATKQLENSLSEKRFTHCCGVMETAFLIADAWKEYPVNRTHLAWAGLFHDCAKELKRDELNHYMQNGEVKYGKELMTTPSLVHAPIGAVVLRLRFHVDHPDILKAVAYHPTGHPTLTPIGCMVYAADYLEPGRYYFEEREELLEAVLKNPLQGLRKITNFRIQRVQELKKPLNTTVLDFKEHLDSIDHL